MTAQKLELREVSKRFAESEAVRDLSLSLGRGEFLSLLGPSGCGKSTTLGMIAGFIRPDAGVILIDGARVNELSPQRRRIGLVLQDYAVFTRLTVRANLAFGLHAKGLKRSERRSAVDGLARLFNLVDLLDRRGGSLNMSEMQRVALARTLGTQPELLLLDEPMSNSGCRDPRSPARRIAAAAEIAGTDRTLCYARPGRGPQYVGPYRRHA